MKKLLLLTCIAFLSIISQESAIFSEGVSEDTIVESVAAEVIQVLPITL